MSLSKSLQRHIHTADFHTIVIGAGVVGLAIARHLIDSGIRDVLLLDKEKQAGTETSSRSSEVIHAGLYYNPITQPLKSKFCVEGKSLLYEYCRKHNIPHSQLGKLVVATADTQIPGLHALQQNAQANGVRDLQWMHQSQVKSLEPNVSCVAALFSPSTGIVDSHALMTSLQYQFESLGGTTAFHSRVQKIYIDPFTGIKSVFVAVPEGTDEYEGEMVVTSQNVVNAAGLHAQRIAHSITPSLPPNTIPPLYLVKGNYFYLKNSQRSSCTHHLVYPMPEPGTAGLGVHLTLDLGGGVRFGPDVEWLPRGIDPENIDYSVDPRKIELFERASREYLPNVINTGSLSPGYSGVRPKVSGPGEPAGDFIVSGNVQHGVEGLVCLFGIESPGLTSALSLAQHTFALLNQSPR